VDENDGGDLVSARATSLNSGARPVRPGAARERRRGLPRLRDAKIRSKLALILVVPVVAIVGLATARLVDSGRQAVDAELVRSLTELSTDINALSDEVQRERMSAATFLAELPPPDGVNAEAFNQQVRATDDKIAEYTRQRNSLGDLPASVQDRLSNIDGKLSTINSTRQEVLAKQATAVSEVVTRYGVIITDLVSYGEVIGQIAGEGLLADSERAVAAFSADKAATGEEQAVAFAALVDNGGQGLAQEQFAGFISTLTAQQEAQVAFSLAATPQLQALVAASVTGDAVFLADQVETELTRSVGARPGITAVDAARAFGAVANLKRFAELRLEQQVLADAEAERTAVLRQVLVESVLVLVTLAIAITLAVVLARSLVRSLSRLREGALSVANRDLPEAVARLRDVRSLGEGGPEEIARQVRDPIRLPNKDEVGQVAVAFNVVHREAVRVAAEQAALRTSVSAMFLNLARRSQALVDRMIGELDKIERGEEDPKRLAQLFQLDHLATRMRRNDENLLVLAGADSTAPRREDALLVDAVRAAQSEVEQYDRIEFGTIDTDVSIAAHAVNDVVRLVAELLDNATRFSPPNQAVVADARRVRDYVLIQIEDRGLGMSDDQLATLNARLAEPPSVDVAAFRMMGLAVVGRLADRYQIRVELRHNPEGGTIAQVSLPTSILILPRVRTREPLLARSRTPLAVEPGPSAWPGAPAPALASRLGAGTLTDRRDQSGSFQTLAGANGPAAAAQGPAGRPPGWPGAGTGAHGQQSPPARVVSAPLGQNYAQNHAQPAAPAPQRPEDTTELPIFREIEAVWFRTHGNRGVNAGGENWSMPTAGYPPPPVVSVGSPVAAGVPVSGSGYPGGPSAPPAGPSGYSAPPPSGYSAPPPSGYSAPPPGSGAHGSGAHGSGVRPGGNGSGAGYGAGRPSGPASPPAGPPPPAGPSRPASPPPPAGPPSRPASPPPPAAYAPPEVPPSAMSASAPGSDPSMWRTAADEGWRRASQAAAPEPAGTTRSGLPKRVPQAQLVPGGVTPAGGPNRAKRTPDEVRGLLSAYHRGVQRGRSAGTANAESRSTEETTG
jgi:signal transduction histidine kinase